MKTSLIGLVLSILLNIISCANAENVIGQTLQVSTHFSSIAGKPSWTLIVRDMESGVVSPYLFDIKNNDNFWVAFTGGHSYRVTVSYLNFGPYAKIKNFCQLENGIITDYSYSIIITGELSPDPSSFKCRVSKYKSMSFPIARPPT